MKSITNFGTFLHFGEKNKFFKKNIHFSFTVHRMRVKMYFFSILLFFNKMPIAHRERAPEVKTRGKRAQTYPEQTFDVARDPREEQRNPENHQ